MMIQKRMAVVLAATVVAAGLPAAAQAQSPTERPSCRGTSDITLSATSLHLPAGDCSWTGRTVRGPGLAATVPGPGQAVAAHALLADGGEATLQVTTAKDGSVAVSTAEPAATMRAAAPTGPPACSDTTYGTAGYSYGAGGNFYWYYNADGDTRSGLSPADAEAGMVNATRNFTAGYNDCGLGRQPNVNQTYGGRTSAGANIIGRGTQCTEADGHSITAWGDMIDGYLAVTCTWSFSNGIVASSDMLTNYNYAWWNGQGTCPNNNYAFHLESVTMHERGHTFGLAHVPAGHDYETMATAIYNCATWPATLALGDYNGLISIYGYR